MYCLMYFDVEDCFSPSDHPVHMLPGQFADIMEKYGLKGSFRITGEKARYMESHNHKSVIESIRRHDVSLHYDRGSIHPTTAEEVSNLDWFQGVDRVLFRELPGFQTMERIFGKCSGITRHGSTVAAQIAYAAGKLGKTFFSGPFNLPGHNVAWFCNNLSVATGEGGNFDCEYCNTPEFEPKLKEQREHLARSGGKVDLVPLFGCHPLKTIMEDFPCGVNFLKGRISTPDQWRPPVMIKGVSIPLILENFERRIKDLADNSDLEWISDEDVSLIYGRRPVKVGARVVEAGAQAVIDNRGPTYTPALSAGELLYLMARRRLAPAPAYAVPQIMGPIAARPVTAGGLPPKDALRELCLDIMDNAHSSGYLPESLGRMHASFSLESVMLALACEVVGTDPASVKNPQVTVAAIPGIPQALTEVSKLKNWRIHGTYFNQENISRYFRWQTWTVKPAFQPQAYGPEIETGRHLNSALPMTVTN